MILFYDTEILLFTRWRALIARAAGYGNEWLEMGDFRIAIPALDYGTLTEENTNGVWNKIPEDPLVILLSHRDDSGYIEAEHCGPIADALDSLKGCLETHSKYEAGSTTAQKETEFHARMTKAFRIASKNNVRIIIGG